MDGLARVALNQLYESEDFVIPLSWSYYASEMSPSVQERYDFYEADIFPSAYFGGTHLVEGWDCSLYTYQQAYNNVVDNGSPFNIDLEFEQIRNEDFMITANVSVTENMQVGDNKVFFVITNWMDYNQSQPWFYLVVAKSDEQDVDIFNSGDNAVYSTELNIDMQPNWNVDDLHAVAIIQNWDDRKILQAEQVSLFPTNADDPIIPNDFVLNQNYPNPFNPETTITFSLPENSLDGTELIIYNSRGQRVKQYTQGEFEGSDNLYSVTWDGTDESNAVVSSGIYFYKLKNSFYTSTKKMILMK